MEALGNAAKIGNPNSIKSLQYFEGLTEKYIAFSHFYTKLGTLSEMHEIVFGKKLTLSDLTEYSVLMRNLPK